MKKRVSKIGELNNKQINKGFEVHASAQGDEKNNDNVPDIPATNHTKKVRFNLDT